MYFSGCLFSIRMVKSLLRGVIRLKTIGFKNSANNGVACKVYKRFNLLTYKGGLQKFMFSGFVALRDSFMKGITPIYSVDDHYMVTTW